VRALESGRCSPEQFACGLVEDWGLQAEPDELLERFRAWPVGPLPGAEELVARLRRSVRVGCLSNTNALHWAEHFSSWRLMELLDPRFLSFQIGVLKPDREVFDHVAAAVGIPRERVLLLDDNVANVEGARAAGFAAIQVTGVDGARATIDSLGLLRSGASD
jgi:putative hydrolase of the HAD superfamily